MVLHYLTTVTSIIETRLSPMWRDCPTGLFLLSVACLHSKAKYISLSVLCCKMQPQAESIRYREKLLKEMESYAELTGLQSKQKEEEQARRAKELREQVRIFASLKAITATTCITLCNCKVVYINHRV